MSTRIENSTLRLVAVLILFWEFHVAIIHMIWFLESFIAYAI